MNRMEKKCLIASGVMHGSLLLLVVFGSAFFTVKNEPPVRMLNVIPSRLIDEALAGGGGNPKLPRTDELIKGDTMQPSGAPAAVAPTAPTAPQPPKTSVEPPPPEPPPRSEPKTEARKETKTEPVKKVELPPKNPKTPKTSLKEPVTPKVEDSPKPRVDLKELVPISRTDTAKRKREQEEEDARQREQERVAAQRAAQRAAAAKAAQARRELAEAFSNIGSEVSRGQSNLKTGFKGGTAVDVGGPGGEAFGSYKMYVQMAYENAWIVVPELTDQDFIAVIKVTVARDGRITASRIFKPSGSATMDRTVRKAMDQVRNDGLPPFPEGAKDTERTFTIEFNLKAKSRLG